ncbi:hypothetical protein [Pasteuria penetrans]|uniref:hypothetical protein n=1 Tax=Pasteuria penetrans TaxID=86005 RepID=UPI0011EBDDDA|nr:hypothetical protein [Pasteuria penetrans]
MPNWGQEGGSFGTDRGRIEKRVHIGTNRERIRKGGVISKSKGMDPYLGIKLWRKTYPLS